MAGQCFRKPNSNPPICGVHNQPLQTTNTSDPTPSTRFYVCQTSGQTIRELEAQPLNPQTLPELHDLQEVSLAELRRLEIALPSAVPAEIPAIQKSIAILTHEIQRLDVDIRNRKMRGGS